MRDARWRRVEELYHASLELRPGDARAAYLMEACAGDEALRREVESLLRHESSSGGFLERSALEDEARALVAEPDTLVGSRIDDYAIVSLAGSGGMGEVYRARDLTLERDVAIKVLPRSGAGDVARFEAEARLASGLNHPNVVTIHRVGRAAGFSYIAMELVRGRTLREILLDGPPPLARALDLGVQIAEALAAAHASGIVHRDLKPENLMVTDEGLLKVLDFGIAKRHGAAEPGSQRQDGTRPLPHTEAGAILGTVGYMSPEQAAGLDVEPASDQFAFGAILYELISGRRAFDRGSREATLDAILHANPDSVEALSGSARAPVRALLARCLAKRPSERFPSARELAAEIRRVRETLGRRESSRAARRRRAGAAALLVVAAAAAILWRARVAGPAVHSIAVLPFSHPAEPPHASAAADGMTRGLIRRLAGLGELAVRPYSSVANFAGLGVDPREAGRRLGTEAVLAGSLAEASGRLRVEARLIDVKSGARLWNRSFDAAAGDALAIQDQIALSVVNDAIRPRLTGDDRRELMRSPTADAEAYDLYLRAVSNVELATEASYLEARDLVRKALARDPNFALAYVTLATTYTVMAVDGYEPPREAAEQVARNVRRALDCDRDLPDAHSEAASALFYFQWDWAGADREWTKAIASRGGGIVPDFLIAWALQRWALGKPDEALDLARRARSLDPLSPSLMVMEADFLLHAARTDEAALLYERVCRTVPAGGDAARAAASRAWLGLAEARRTQGRWDDAIDARRRAAEPDEPVLGEIYATERGESGYRRIERADARMQLESLRGRAAGGEYVSPLDVSRACAMIGDRQCAFSQLDAALTERSPGLIFLNVDRAWDAVRDDPRFADAVRRVGLPSPAGSPREAGVASSTESGGRTSR